jgi:arylformamidase
MLNGNHDRAIIDISPMISSRLAVFPGDVSFSRKVSMDFSQGHHLSLSSMSTTLHLGAHADAPSHYHPQGKSIEQCSLSTYLGPCQVVDLSPWKGPITLAALGNRPIQAPRVLFKTGSFSEVEQWSGDFAYLTAETVKGLAERGVCLVGIDTPSMDEATSKDLTTHQAFFSHQIAILEGLVLESVPEGCYELIALPLKIEGGEASPVRAVLLEIRGDSK